jgi:GH24 family phage-related lysozyme (muramidase)
MNKATIAQQATTASFLPPVQGILQRKCACGNHTVAGGECAGCARNKSGFQRKPTIGANNDPLEQEADRVANQVMAAPTHPAVSATPLRIQRYAGQATEDTDTAPASVNRVLASPGRPLDTALWQDMGQRFGYDFSRVRVHSGAAAEQSAREVNANAYTIGDNIVFGSGRYSPGTHEGRRLIAHELTHVVQQQQQPSFAKIQREDLANDPYPATEDGDQPNMFSTSDEGLEFLKKHEGVKLNLYNDSQGHCTIGIGHLVHMGKCNGTELPNYKSGLSEEDVMDLFRNDITKFESGVVNNITSRLNQYQFDALVSFIFNIGIGAFKDSGVLKEMNAKTTARFQQK